MEAGGVAEVLEPAAIGMHAALQGATGSTARSTGSLKPLVHAAGLYQIVSVTQEDQDNMFVRTCVPGTQPNNTDFRCTDAEYSLYFFGYTSFFIIPHCAGSFGKLVVAC